MKSLFFVAVFNQNVELPRLIAEFKQEILPCTTLLFVDNASTDGSRDIIIDSGYDYLFLDKNVGVGGAFMAAVEWALARDYDIIGSIAGNGKMLPSEMHRVLSPIINQEADYVTGSRFLQGGDSPNLPTFRRNAIPMVNWYVRFITGRRISDATCGYRVMSMDIFKLANFDWHAPWLHGYCFEYYIYAKVLLSSRFRWVEVPITMRYPSIGRYTKIKPFIGWYGMLKPWFLARFDGYGFTS